jgi:heme exporter protein D
MSWSEFFHMGGYGFYVWGSYLIAFVLLAGEVVFLLRRQKALRKRVSQHSSSNNYETST